MMVECSSILFDESERPSSVVDIVSSDESSSELFDFSDKMASTAVFSSDARDFFCFFGSCLFRRISEVMTESSVEASDEDLETVRGIVSDCAEVHAAVYGPRRTVEW
jgi:hypothetical protein